MPAAPITVTALSATPVKGLRIAARPALRLERDRIAGDRLFYLVDERGRLVNGKRVAGLHAVTAEFDERDQRLTLGFPGGGRASAPVELGAELRTRFYSSERAARLVGGPFAGALSQQLGFAVRLVAPSEGGAGADRGLEGTVSLISRASLQRLADVAGVGEIDGRRFRMSIEIDGVAAHAEDAWVGMRLAVGEARIALGGHVGRCIVTTRDPESDRVDLPTLDLLRSYRAAAATSEPLAFGVYGSVLVPGTVRVGDRVELEPR